MIDLFIDVLVVWWLIVSGHSLIKIANKKTNVHLHFHENTWRRTDED